MKITLDYTATGAALGSGPTGQEFWRTAMRHFRWLPKGDLDCRWFVQAGIIEAWRWR